jgi:hypothetical protein
MAVSHQGCLSLCLSTTAADLSSRLLIPLYLFIKAAYVPLALYHRCQSLIKAAYLSWSVGITSLYQRCASLEPQLCLNSAAPATATAPPPPPPARNLFTPSSALCTRTLELRRKLTSSSLRVRSLFCPGLNTDPISFCLIFLLSSRCGDRERQWSSQRRNLLPDTETS